MILPPFALLEAGAKLLSRLELLDPGDASVAIRTFLEQYGGSCSWLISPQQAALSLLDILGSGTYRPETNEWSPTSRHVFTLSLEVLDLPHMYTQALQGVQAIVGDELTFREIVEDASNVDYETISGIQSVRFSCSGTTCRYNAPFNGDWFDPGFLIYLGQALAQVGHGKTLWIPNELDLTCTLFYQTADWAKRFSKLLGCSLSPAAEGRAWKHPL